MPTYEYQCRSCKHRFETWQKMTDEPLTICPECGGSIHRLFFPAGIVFKGSGFYKTDHPANGPVAENGHDHKSDGAKSTKESDTKAATESKAGGNSSDSSGTKAGANSSNSPGTKTGENSVAVEAK